VLVFGGSISKEEKEAVYKKLLNYGLGFYSI
jgi:hypothetical protein